ncbi:hypothetical protein FJ987_04710 [Mesorhizobium sp. CU2]|uniref:hypothetical protein n=1 Tax=unclassified Mesorhizobium TaxID=325217 RepID=UPI00112673A4|nr:MULTISPECIES: hypothetical protein [unclassified Mesorhizobium]TPN86624.1 hypothetical protein FJ988_07575 [Mesorhizobium sp. CU3]TPO20442.1 hypothetical protein FJ987_04710 [Mesorhizobium sp. CU2]
MKNTPENETAPEVVAEKRRPYLTSVFGAGLIAFGLVAGAGATLLAVPRADVVLLQPTSIGSLAPYSTVAVKGKVAEVFGNKFVIEDGTGRALVETGPRGDNAKLVAAGETLTVQGHFDDGFIHGDLLVHADGHAESLKPPRPGPRGLVDRLREPELGPAAPGA